jgi:hypothetical protein
MTRKVILCASTKNELHNLKRILPAWLLFADQVVVADQMSYDGTREFLSRFDRVHMIDNRDAELNEHNRIQLVVAKARSLDPAAVLLFLDADEILSPNVLTSLEWTSFREAAPGTTGQFLWITLHGSIRRHVATGDLGAPSPGNFAFIDDGRPIENTRMIHSHRGPGLAMPTRLFRFNEVVNLHFFMTNPDVYRKKQNWYKMFWLKKGGKYFYTNRNHGLHEAIGQQHIAACPQDWWQGFADRGLDLTSVEAPTLLWYDVEILQYMAAHGTRKTWLLDIWNQDWEFLRQLAIKEGHAGIPTEPIKSPPGWVQRYNNWTLGRRSGLRKPHVALGRLIKRKVLP